MALRPEYAVIASVIIIIIAAALGVSWTGGELEDFPTACGDGNYVYGIDETTGNLLCAKDQNTGDISTTGLTVADFNNFFDTNWISQLNNQDLNNTLNYLKTQDRNLGVGAIIQGSNITVTCTGADNNGYCTINSTATSNADRNTGVGKAIAGNNISITCTGSDQNGFCTFSTTNGGNGYIRTYTFASLDSNGKITITHSLNTSIIQTTTYNDQNKQIIPDEIELIDNNSLKIDLNSYGNITGIWKTIINSGGTSTTTSDGNGITLSDFNSWFDGNWTAQFNQKETDINAWIAANAGGPLITDTNIWTASTDSNTWWTQNFNTKETDLNTWIAAGTGEEDTDTNYQTAGADFNKWVELDINKFWWVIDWNRRIEIDVNSFVQLPKIWEDFNKFSGSYNDLNGKPTIPSIWTDYNQFSGSYNDLNNKPTIPPLITDTNYHTGGEDFNKYWQQDANAWFEKKTDLNTDINAHIKNQKCARCNSQK